MSRVLLFVSVCLIFSSCAMSPEAKQQAISTLNDMMTNGQITQSQFDSLLAALQGGGLRSVLGDVADGVVAVALSWLGWKGVAPRLFGNSKKPVVEAKV